MLRNILFLAKQFRAFICETPLLRIKVVYGLVLTSKGSLFSGQRVNLCGNDRVDNIKQYCVLNEIARQPTKPSVKLQNIILITRYCNRLGKNQNHCTSRINCKSYKECQTLHFLPVHS